MNQVLGTFRSSVGVAVDTPGHGLLSVGAVLVALVIGGVLGFIPIVGPMVSSVLVSPLILAAVLGSANAARNDESVVEGLKRGVSESGTSLVGAFGLVYAVFLGVSMVLGIGMVVVLMFTIGIGSATDPSVGTLFSGVFGVVAILLFLAVVALGLAGAFAIQFVGPAAVVAGTGAVDSLKTSYRFFRRNVLGVLGFSAVVFGITLLAYVPAVVGYVVGTVAASDIVALALGAGGYLLAFAVVTPVLTIYQVEYFDTVADASVLPTPDGTTRTTRDATIEGTVTETEQSRDESTFAFGDERDTDGIDDERDAGTGTDDSDGRW